MDCLIGYIGIKDIDGSTTGVPVPDSGIYINSLAGINTEILQDAADSDGKTFDRLWQDVQQEASRRFFSDNLTKLGNKYKLSRNSGDFAINGTILEGTMPAEQAKKGIILDFETKALSMQSIYISKATFNSPAAGNTILFVQDLDGAVLYQKNVALVQGLNTFLIKKPFPLQTIFIGLNFDALPTPASLLGVENVQTALNTVTTGAAASVAGAVFKNGSYNISATETFGFTLIEGKIQCSFQALVCSHKEAFTSAWMYLLGNQILLEIVGSNRINKTTTVNQDKYTELKDFYQVEYEKELKEAIASINLSERDGCIECQKNPQKVIWLP